MQEELILTVVGVRPVGGKIMDHGTNGPEIFTGLQKERSEKKGVIDGLILHENLECSLCISS